MNFLEFKELINSLPVPHYANVKIQVAVMGRKYEDDDNGIYTTHPSITSIKTNKYLRKNAKLNSIELEIDLDSQCLYEPNDHIMGQPGITFVWENKK